MTISSFIYTAVFMKQKELEKDCSPQLNALVTPRYRKMLINVWNI